MHLCAYSYHAVKQSLRVSGGFSGGFVACFAGSRQKRLASQAVLITDVMVNVKNISLIDKKAFKKNDYGSTNFDGPELCT